MDENVSITMKIEKRERQKKCDAQVLRYRIFFDGAQVEEE